MILREFLHSDPVATSHVFGCGRTAATAVDPVGDITRYLAAGVTASLIGSKPLGQNEPWNSAGLSAYSHDRGTRKMPRNLTMQRKCEAMREARLRQGKGLFP